MQARTLPRGLRNNNPLNIRISATNWRGKMVPSQDKAFEQFRDIYFGIRAGLCIIRTYINKYRLTTVAQVIARWAPECENDTSAYVRSVLNRANISPTERLQFNNKNQMCRLCWAMALVECGQQFKDTELRFSLFERAYEMV